MSENIIEFQNITKRFGGTTALDEVSFNVKKGDITGLIGENGAGKSTLINICGGAVKPDEGQIIFNGEKVSIKHPRQAEELGISIVHQEIPICPEMSAAGNIFIGPNLPGKMGFLDWDYMFKKTGEIFERLNVKISPRKPVNQCSIGEQQLILLSKALSRNSRFILLDEPTSALSPVEVEVLYKVFNRLKEEGITILFISHRIEEVKRISDRVYVLKDGKYVGKLEREELTLEKMARMMVGRDVKMIRKKKSEVISEEAILEVKKLNYSNFKLKDIDFKLKKGEILGFAGLRGAGRTELAKCIIGYFKADSGEIYIEGKKVNINSPKDAIRYGIGYLSEDRNALGIFKAMNIKNNLCIALIDNLAKIGIVNNKKVNNISNKFKEELKIKLLSLIQNIGELSGGNQQKVLLARWLAVQPRILILDEPTRGVDVGTKEEIRKIIGELAQKGYSIIMISSEMLEIIGISDRILVFSRGTITGEFSSEEVNEEKIMFAAVDQR